MGCCLSAARSRPGLPGQRELSGSFWPRLQSSSSGVDLTSAPTLVRAARAICGGAAGAVHQLRCFGGSGYRIVPRTRGCRRKHNVATKHRASRISMESRSCHEVAGVDLRDAREVVGVALRARPRCELGAHADHIADNSQPLVRGEPRLRVPARLEDRRVGCQAMARGA